MPLYYLPDAVHSGKHLTHSQFFKSLHCIDTPSLHKLSHYTHCADGRYNNNRATCPMGSVRASLQWTAWAETSHKEGLKETVMLDRFHNKHYKDGQTRRQADRQIDRPTNRDRQTTSKATQIHKQINTYVNRTESWTTGLDNCLHHNSTQYYTYSIFRSDAVGTCSQFPKSTKKTFLRKLQLTLPRYIE